MSRRSSPPEAADGTGVEMWELRLFVAGSDLASRRVHEALETLCQKHLAGRYRIVLVDIVQDPEQAEAYDIVAVPTLLRQTPPPRRRVIGDLSQTGKVLLGLGMPAPEES